MHFLLANCCLSLCGLGGRMRILRGGLSLARRIVHGVRTQHARKATLGGSVAHCRLRGRALGLRLTGMGSTYGVVGRRLIAALRLPTKARVVPSSALLSRRIGALTRGS